VIPLHTAAWVIASVHLGTLVRSRRAWACAGLLLLPALIAWIVAGSYAKATPSGLTTMLGWNALLQVSVPLVSLLMGVAVVAEEVDDRTITYLFLRPIPRTALLYGRLVTSVLWLAVCAAVAVALLVAAASTADGSDAGITNGVRLPLLLAVQRSRGLHRCVCSTRRVGEERHDRGLGLHLRSRRLLVAAARP